MNLEHFSSFPGALLRRLSPARALSNSKDLAAIASVVKNAGELAQGVEGKFMGLAHELELLYQCAGELGRAADERFASIFDQLEKTKITGAHGLARQALNQLHAGLEEAQRVHEELAFVANEVGTLTRHSSSIARIARHLRIAEYGFAVESSRCPESTQKFSSFVEDLHRLTVRTADLGDAMGEQAKEAKGDIDSAVQSISSSLGELQQVTKKSEVTVQETSASVESLMSASHTAVSSASNNTKAIAKHVSDATYYLQFGDILRQKLEHVVAGMEEAAQLLKAQAGKKQTPSQRAVQADRLFEIQVAQLHSMQDEIESASQRLEVAFSGIGAETQHMVGAISTLEEQQTAGSESAFTKLQRELESLNDLHFQGSDLRDRARELAARAMTTIAHLSGHLGDLQMVNLQMQRQGLNAIIHAEGLGEKGRTLTILSEEIHGVFQNSANVVTATVQVVGEIEAHRLAVKPLEEAGSGRSSEFDVCIAALAQIDSEFQKTVTASQDLASRQNAQLEQTRTQLHVLSEFSTRIGELISMGEDVRAHLTRWKDASGAEVELEMDSSRYTMASERDVHLRLAGAKTAASEGAEPEGEHTTEVFTATDSTEDGNIELF